MGLDMFLNAKRSCYNTAQSPVAQEIHKLLGLAAGVNVTGVEVEAGYWRKVNHVHQWFVQNVAGGVDDCTPMVVSRDNLLALRKACVSVHEDHSKAAELLPTQDGFFFGPTGYEERYFASLVDTVRIIDVALELEARNWQIQYEASW